MCPHGASTGRGAAANRRSPLLNGLRFHIWRPHFNKAAFASSTASSNGRIPKLAAER